MLVLMLLSLLPLPSPFAVIFAVALIRTALVEASLLMEDATLCAVKDSREAGRASAEVWSEEAGGSEVDAVR